MYETDFAMYDGMGYLNPAEATYLNGTHIIYLDGSDSTYLGEGESGVDLGSVLATQSLSGQSLPEGTETMSVGNISFDENGRDFLETQLLIRLPGQNRWMTYFDWFMGQNPAVPTTGSEWVIGSQIDKGEYSLLVVRQMVIVDGQEVAKPFVLIREGGSGGYISLNEWDVVKNEIDTVKKNAG